MKKEGKTLYKGKMVRTLDLTPTWKQVLPILLEGLKSERQEARDASLHELNRMAEICDAYKELTEGLKKSGIKIEDI
jgi:hypothetical protein